MIHHVYANQSNIGDWLSAIGIQSLLAPRPVTEHLCDDPFVGETLRRLSTTGPDDLIVVGGGGLFMDYFTPLWEGLRGIAERTPLCIWGVGFCDLKRKPSRAPRKLLAEVIRRSRLCVVRDELTRHHLSEVALPPPVACPSLCAVSSVPETGRGLLHVDNFTTAGQDVYEAMDIFGRQFARDTDRAYRTTNNRIETGRKGELQQTLNLYSQADLVLASALHGCIIAAAMGRNILAVSGDYKIESFMNAMGLGQWVCDINELERLPTLLAGLHTQSPCDGAVTAARDANQRVAQQIAALADGIGSA